MRMKLLMSAFPFFYSFLHIVCPRGHKTTVFETLYLQFYDFQKIYYDQCDS